MPPDGLAGFLLLERVRSQASRGCVPLRAIRDPTSGGSTANAGIIRAPRPHHLLCATPQALCIVPLSYDDEDGPRLHFNRMRSLKVNDVILRIWEYETPDGWQSQAKEKGLDLDALKKYKSPYEINGVAPSIRYCVEKTRKPTNHWTSDFDVLGDAFIMLTERFTLCLFAVHVDKVTLRCMAELDCLSPGLPTPMTSPMAAMDPYARALLLYIYEGQVEYITINRLCPLAWTASTPLRLVEPDIQRFQFLQNPIPLTKQRSKRVLAAVNQSKSARSNATTRPLTAHSQEEVWAEDRIKPLQIAVLFSSLPDMAIEARIAQCVDCRDQPLQLRIVELGDTQIISTEDMKASKVLKLPIHSATGAMLDASDGTMIVLGAQQAVAVRWDEDVENWTRLCSLELAVKLSVIVSTNAHVCAP